jgi:DNA-binding Xre family transcriptional regulator
VIHWHLQELIGRANAQDSEGADTQIDERTLADATGLNMDMVSQMVNGQVQNVDLKAVDQLLTYFSKVFGEEMEVGDLLSFEWDPEEPLGGG